MARAFTRALPWPPLQSLQLSQLPGYSTGGTVHIVINNQIGYTTPPAQACTSNHATDIAKVGEAQFAAADPSCPPHLGRTFRRCLHSLRHRTLSKCRPTPSVAVMQAAQAPIFHCNADDPEAVCEACHIAAEWRSEFGTDVVVDLVGYRCVSTTRPFSYSIQSRARTHTHTHTHTRTHTHTQIFAHGEGCISMLLAWFRRFGHNEQDDPTATLPLTYRAVNDHVPVVERYTRQVRPCLCSPLFSPAPCSCLPARGISTVHRRQLCDGSPTGALEERGRPWSPVITLAPWAAWLQSAPSRICDACTSSMHASKRSTSARGAESTPSPPFPISNPKWK